MSDRPMPGIADLEFVSTGACPGCAECGLADVDPDDEEALQSASEEWFSKAPCEACGSTLHGSRVYAHGRDTTAGDLYHLSVCLDCESALNGLVPDELA